MFSFSILLLGVNYFGLCLCPLIKIEKRQQKIEFFNDVSNNKSILNWNVTSLYTLLNSKKENKYAKYFGNPWKNSTTTNTNTLAYVFVNFYFYNIMIKKVVLDVGVSDNHVIGVFTGKIRKLK